MSLASESHITRRYRLPNLNNVVLSSRTHDPRIGRIPRNITHAIRMSTMHKQQFRRPILCIVGSLLNPNPRKIPNDNPPIIPRRRKNRFLVRRPRDRRNLIPMPLKGMQLEFEVPQIPEGDGAIARGGEEDVFGRGVEGEGVDGLVVGFDC